MPFSVSGPGEIPAPVPVSTGTLAMPDSITPPDLPAGYPAYLGYADGKWATCPQVKHDHPAAYHVCLTVTGATLSADGVDCEPGNPNAASSANWVQQKLAHAPDSRPVVYANLGSPGYSMAEVISDLSARGITRDKYRILTAHWTDVAHVCGPRTCGGLDIDADGTQWTDAFPGLNGHAIDMSELVNSFFTGGTVPPAQITAPPGTWLNGVFTGRGTDGRLFTATWDGQQWHKTQWPVPEVP